MQFALAMFRDRPDEMVWQRDGWMQCYFPLVPFVQVPVVTVRSLVNRRLIEEKEPGLMTLSDAGRRAAVGLPKVWDHAEEVMALQARRVVHEALKRAVKGTRRKAIVRGAA
jgi:hypothetical protein